MWELHFDDGGMYGDGLEVNQDDSHPLEWPAKRAAMIALDVLQFPDQRPFLGIP